VHIDFSLPQQRLSEVSVGQGIRVTLDGATNPLDGKITAVDPTVDAATRQIKLRGDVSKPEGLRPGMFVQVSVVLPDRAKAVIVPATAIVHAPYGDSLFVVEEKKADMPGPAQTPDGKPIKVARQQFVKVGQARGDFVAVADGLKAKEEVVTAGAFKLRNNAPIFIDNSKPMTPSLTPNPANR